MEPSWFESMVVESWSKAVFEGAHRFSEAREHIVCALRSENGEVRSAAVATLNEANDIESHDLVVRLANDEDLHVREEVLEYIEQFPKAADANFLLEKLRLRENVFIVSSALNRLCGGVGPIIGDDESEDVVIKRQGEWEQILKEHGYYA